MSTLSFLALVTPPVLLGVHLLVETLRGLVRLPRLAEVSTGERVEWPSVTIVSPACNEEEAIEGAMSSLLSLDYPTLDLVAVDDRSTDRTGAILDGLAAQEPRLSVLHLDAIPEGWLGKVHALARGTEQASGTWLAVMDADAHLAPGALRRAVTHAEEHEFDLLSVVPTIRPSGWLTDATFGLSLALLSAGGRLRAVERADNDVVAATGAFILVRRSTLERTEGFAWLRREVADDFGLALLVKSHGGRIAMLNGRGEVELTWYGSIREMCIAMQKNLFAILGRFSLPRMVALALASFYVGLSPLLALVAPTGLLALLPLVGAACAMGAAGLASRATGRSGVASWLYPLGSLVFGAMILRAALVGWRLGGILWRGKLYTTEELAPHQRVRI